MTNDGTTHILVVDDDALTLKFCTEILADAGYNVVGAQNAAKALGMLRSSFFHLVISDINMPGLNGIEFYNAAVWDDSLLRNRFLFMTANLPDTLKTYMDEWGLKCLCKPFKISEFIDCAGSIISRWEARKTTNGRGTEQRQSLRFAFMKRCVIRGAGGHGPAIEFNAIVQDISAAGLKLVNCADADFMALQGLTDRATVQVEIDGRKFANAAQMVWSQKTDAGTNIGLKFQEPVSAMDVSGIMPLRPLYNGQAARAARRPSTD